MSDIVISVKNLSKMYKLYRCPSDRLKETFHPFKKPYHERFYALQSVSFDVRRGEAIGIIGRNGSGKSTLLRVISRVLQPTSGTVAVNGRISALLELGAGFNPEYTGTENVYMNAAILGYSKKEIDAIYDDIVAFADIGEFINQPVKTYSTGMFVRLAFAIAITVKPDIIIVDEALAVGDEAFQRKCYSRVLDFIQSGRTLLFVSHSAQLIVELCDRALLLERGELLLDADPRTVVTSYQRLIYAPPEKAENIRGEIQRGQLVSLDKPGASSGNAGRAGTASTAEPTKEEPEFFDPNLVSQSRVEYESRGAIIRNVHISTISGQKVNHLCRNRVYFYNYDVEFTKDAYAVRFGSMFKTVTGLQLGGIRSHRNGDFIDFIPKGKIVSVKVKFHCWLNTGVYFTNAGVTERVEGGEVFLHRIVDVLIFKVMPSPTDISGLVDFALGEETDIAFY